MEALDLFDVHQNPQPTEPPSQKKQTCILALKVFDWCVKPLTETDCFPIPPECAPPAPPGSTATCTATYTATIVAQTPLPGNIHTITARVDKTKTITIFNPDGTVRCTFTGTASSFHTTSLFAPPGTTKQVEVSGECGPCQVSADGTTVCCEQSICLEFESKAPIKLCVPAEPCIPRRCTQPVPPCPPTPPQTVRLCPTPTPVP